MVATGQRATVAMNLHVVHENRDLQFVVVDCSRIEVQWSGEYGVWSMEYGVECGMDSSRVE